MVKAEYPDYVISVTQAAVDGLILLSIMNLTKKRVLTLLFLWHLEVQEDT